MLELEIDMVSEKVRVKVFDHKLVIKSPQIQWGL